MKKNSMWQMVVGTLGVASAVVLTGCADSNGDDEPPTGSPVSVEDDGLDSKVFAGVCNYGAGQTIVVGPVTSPVTYSGCCSHTYVSYGIHVGTLETYSCPTRKTQYFGCSDGSGSLLSWGAYTVSGVSETDSLPAGASVCNTN